MTRYAISVLISVGTSASALAQPLTATLTTAKDYGNYAAEGPQIVGQGWPRGYQVASGISIVGASSANTSADTVVNLQASGTSVSVSVSEQGAGWAVLGSMDVGTMSRLTPPPAPIDSTPHELEFVVRGVPTQRGKLEVWANGDLDAGAEARMWVDVGRNGSDDFEHAVRRGGSFDRRQWDVQLDAKGELSVAVRTSARARVPMNGLTGYITGLTVRFTPGRFTSIASEGPTCGVRATAYDRRTATGGLDVVVEIGAAPSAAPGVTVIGTQQVRIPLPGGTCDLLTLPIVAVPLTTDARGEATLVLPVRPAIGRFSLRLQHVALRATGIVASNALNVKLDA